MSYVPDRGDVVWITLDPQAGHEQAGRRPALVLSPAIYNQASGLAIFCPITTRVKGYLFEVPIPSGQVVSGVVLADHAKSLDSQARQVEFIGKFPADIVVQVLGKLNRLLST